jgi:hypothetical protein
MSKRGKHGKAEENAGGGRTSPGPLTQGLKQLRTHSDIKELGTRSTGLKETID